MDAIGILIAIVIAILIAYFRLKKTKKPVTTRKIILPSIIMIAVGYGLLTTPQMQLDMKHIVIATGIGVIFSIPLILTTSFEAKENEIFMKSSQMFAVTLVGLYIIRTLIRYLVSTSLTPNQSGTMFFLMAVSMITPWRIGMLVKFKKFKKSRTQVDSIKALSL